MDGHGVILPRVGARMPCAPMPRRGARLCAQGKPQITQIAQKKSTDDADGVMPCAGMPRCPVGATGWSPRRNHRLRRLRRFVVRPFGVRHRDAAFQNGNKSAAYARRYLKIPGIAIVFVSPVIGNHPPGNRVPRQPTQRHGLARRWRQDNLVVVIIPFTVLHPSIGRLIPNIEQVTVVVFGAANAPTVRRLPL